MYSTGRYKASGSFVSKGTFAQFKAWVWEENLLEHACKSNIKAHVVNEYNTNPNFRNVRAFTEHVELFRINKNSYVDADIKFGIINSNCCKQLSSIIHNDPQVFQ